MHSLRILLVREGDFHIHLHQLAELLTDEGHSVEILHTANGPAEPLYRALIEQMQARGIPCHLIHGGASWVERKMVSLAFRLRLLTKGGVITPHKIREARRRLSGRGPFDLVIAIDPPSLFLACQLFATELNKVLEYSLEVSDESHLDFQESRTEQSFRYFERATLPKLAGLIIQDRFRAEVLLRHVPAPERVTTIYYPVAMRGAGRHKPPRPPGADVRVLFFGGLWSADFLRQLQLVSTRFRDDQVLMIRGGRGTVPLTPMAGSRLDMSTVPVPFDQVNDQIASADIGLALYPKDEANSRRSAFAGEKVARYLQCGLPFIAFDSPDYAFLRDETGCCVLVRDYGEVPGAVDAIMANYPRYCDGAASAFARFYTNTHTGPELVRQLRSLCAKANS